MTATLALIQPAISAPQARLAEARQHTPGGQLTQEETRAIAASEAKAHGMTPEDLLHWATTHPE
jgi:hypothetical protein